MVRESWDFDFVNVYFFISVITESNNFFFFKKKGKLELYAVRPTEHRLLLHTLLLKVGYLTESSWFFVCF